MKADKCGLVIPAAFLGSSHSILSLISSASDTLTSSACLRTLGLAAISALNPYPSQEPGVTGTFLHLCPSSAFFLSHHKLGTSHICFLSFLALAPERQLEDGHQICVVAVFWHLAEVVGV